jgi:glycosyltransferase involved in cell wall biosynthesis
MELAVDSKPLVSVIVPFWNAERFIEEAIESVFAQTYDNWELLLVDDGSVDGSTDIALRYAQRQPERVRYLEHPGHQNRGVGAARNLGIRNAEGEYIAFLDADDVWLPHKLEQQLEVLVSHPEAAMVYGPEQVWYSWTGDAEDFRRDRVITFDGPVNTLYRPPTLLTLLLQGKSVWPFPTSTLVARRVVEDIGGFEEAFRNNEDLIFAAKIFVEAPVFVVEECLSRLRQHGNGLSVLTPAEARSAERCALRWLDAYLARQGIKDIELWNALRKALWPYRHPGLHRASTIAKLLRKELDWLACRVRMSFVTMKRGVLCRVGGSITADPNPVWLAGLASRPGKRFGKTTLSWTSRGTQEVQVRVGSPDGPLLSHSGPSGTATTGLWVTDGMVFCLQNVSGQLPLTWVNTLAVVRVGVRVSDEPMLSGLAV